MAKPERKSNGGSSKPLKNVGRPSRESNGVSSFSRSPKWVNNSKPGKGYSNAGTSYRPSEEELDEKVRRILEGPDKENVSYEQIESEQAEMEGRLDAIYDGPGSQAVRDVSQKQAISARKRIDEEQEEQFDKIYGKMRRQLKSGFSPYSSLDKHQKELFDILMYNEERKYGITENDNEFNRLTRGMSKGKINSLLVKRI